MNRRTLYNVKKDGEVPIDGIYIKNEYEEKKSKNPMIQFHKAAEQKAIHILKDFAMKKNMESDTAIDLIGKVDEKTIYVEVERDNATKKWTNSKNFPYPLINIPIEKRRHFIKYRYYSFYLKFNRSLNVLFILYGEDILKFSKQNDLMANHGGVRAKRTFLRINKEHAKFSDANNTKEILQFISERLK